MAQENDNEVKLVFLINPDSPVGWARAETPWGAQIQGNEHGGTYRILNDGGLVPFMYGDVLTAEVSGDGRLQVTGIESIAQGTGTSVWPPKGTKANQNIRMAAVFKQYGADWTSGENSALKICLPPEKSSEEILLLYAENLPLSWEIDGFLPYEDRLEAMIESTIFDLDLTNPFAEDDTTPGENLIQRVKRWLIRR